MNISCHKLMGAEKLHIYITMMGGPLRAGVCVAIWVMLVARAGAQAGDNLQAPYSTAGPFLTPVGLRRFINGPTSTSLETRLRLLQKNTSLEDLERIGGRVEEQPSGDRWVIKEHSYRITDDVEETQPRTNPVNGHTGGVWMTLAGEATQEGPHHPLADLEILDGEEQVSETSGDQGRDENPDSYLNGPAENKSSPVPDVDSADWSRDSGQWMYRDGEWMVVRLPDPAYPSLPTPPPPAAALVVVGNKKVEVMRNVSGLANVTLHYRFYLSDSQSPDTPPELKVYHVVDGTRNLLQEDTEQGDWYSRTLEVPQADVSSILFEGWLRGDGDVIALSNVDTAGVTLDRDEPLDVGDQLTLTAGQPNTTENLASTPTTEGNRTQDSPAPEEVSVATDIEDHDNNTATSVPSGTHLDPSSDSTANTSQSSAPGEVETGNVTEMPVNTSELEASTDNPENETRTSEQINGSTNIVALNSSMSSNDNATTSDSESGYFNSTTTTDEEESEIDEGASTTTTVTVDEATTPENGPEAVFGTDNSTDNSSFLSIPGVTTDSLQTNTSVTLPVGNTTETNGPLINTGISVNRTTPSTRTRVTNGHAISTNVFGGDELTSGTTLGAPESNETSGSVTSPSHVTISLKGSTPESTSLPPPAGNSTDAVTAVPVSSTSWQVFQVFLVLCVMGLLALGFLYWKRKRRQDDEIPVFTRHTDYHNPTFTMEDAANFMSRAGRNTYKTIE